MRVRQVFNSSDRTVGNVRRAGVAVFLVSLALFMLHRTWLRWLDPIIDVGRELYLPWQLSQGKTLYLDIHSFYGPLSPYFNAAWFRLFGVSLLTLVWVNTGVVLIVTALIYAIVREMASRLAAVAGSAAFLTIFAFSHSLPVGNSNFITPYSHEATHGLALAAAALYALVRYHRRPRKRTLALLGALLGLTFLTKPELFVAAAITSLVALPLMEWPRNKAQSRQFNRGALLAILLIASLLPPTLAFLLMCFKMPAGMAIRGTLGSWLFLTDSTVTHSFFYQSISGFDVKTEAFQRLAESATLFTPVVLPILMVGYMSRVRRPVYKVFSFLLGGFVLCVLKLCVYRLYWSQLQEFLTPAAFCFTLFYAGKLWRGRKGIPSDSRILPLFCLSLFSLLLLLKIMLRPSLDQYGFVLAIFPFTLLVIHAVDIIPNAFSSAGRDGCFIRGAAYAAVLLVCLSRVNIGDEMIRAESHPLGAGSDRFFTDDRGPLLAEALRTIEALPPGSTLTAVPEGIMLNYLARRVNPVPYVTFLPSDMDMFSERTLLASFISHAPDYIAIVHRPTAEYGLPDFGKDYGRSIRAWIAANYTPEKLIGQTPFTDPRQFGILLLRRNKS